MNSLQKKLVIGGLAILAVLSPFFIYKERRSFQCSGCLSIKHMYQWHAGIWSEFSIPISFPQTAEEKSHTVHDFVPPNHTHNWVFAQASPYVWFGTKWAGCAIGRGRSRNEFAHCYEDSEDFRRFIRKKQREGLDSEVVYQMLILPKSLVESQKNDLKFIDYYRRSKELYQEYWHLNEMGVQ